MGHGIWQGGSIRQWLVVAQKRMRQLRLQGDARDVITSLEQVTPEWLTRVLRRNGFLRRAAVVSIEFGERRALTTSEVAYLYVIYSPRVNLPTRFFIKYIQNNENGKWNSSAKREALFYRMTGKLPLPPAAQIYDERHTSDYAKGHLLLQDLTTTHYQWWDMSPAQQEVAYPSMIRYLARFHAAWWQHRLLESEFAAIPAPDFLETARAQTLAQLGAFSPAMGTTLTPAQCAFSERMLESAVWKNVWAWTRPREQLTLEHGQPHLANFMFERADPTLTAALLDWQSYHVGVGAFDLAFLLVWFLDKTSRADARTLLTTYYQQLCAHGVQNYSFAQLDLDFRWGIVQLWRVVLKLGAEGKKKDVTLARLHATWRALQEWQGEALLAENRAQLD